MPPSPLLSAVVPCIHGWGFNKSSEHLESIRRGFPKRAPFTALDRNVVLDTSDV